MFPSTHLYSLTNKKKKKKCIYLVLTLSRHFSKGFTLMNLQNPTQRDRYYYSPCCADEERETKKGKYISEGIIISNNA